MLLDAAAMRLDDLFEFSVERTRIDDDLLAGGQRWTVTATLAGREFERMAIDTGYAATPVLEPETVASSHLLDFAGLETLRVPALAIEQHVAEKLHAYTRTYAGDKPSSRIKDLVDLVVIAHTTTIDADKLKLATGAIFERRATHPVPAAVPAPPVDWAPGWRRLVADMPVEDDVRAGHFAVAAFLIRSSRATSRPGAGSGRPGMGWILSPIGFTLSRSVVQTPLRRARLPVRVAGCSRLDLAQHPKLDTTSWHAARLIPTAGIRGEEEQRSVPPRRCSP